MISGWTALPSVGKNGEIVLWVYDGVAQGGEVLCGGRRLTLTLSRNGDAETMLTLAALDGDGNELDLRNSGDDRIKLQAHWDAKVVRQPVQIETELISNGSDGLAYGDTLEMTAVVNVQPTDAKWSIRWQYSQDGEHFEDVEGANEMRYAVKSSTKSTRSITGALWYRLKTERHVFGGQDGKDEPSEKDYGLGDDGRDARQLLPDDGDCR